MQNISSRGPIVFTYNTLFGLKNVYDTFKIIIMRLIFFSLKMFYPPEGTLQSRYRRRSNCFTYVLFVLGNVYWTFKKVAEIFGYWTGWKLELSYPPKRRLLADSRGVRLFLLMFWFCVRKRILDFQNPHISSAFLRPWKCFIPRRDVCLQTPKGSICFYLCFILC